MAGNICLALALGSVASAALACEEAPVSGGKCFTLRGRVSLYNGTPSMRIWPIGSKRLLGVVPAEHEDAPANIKGVVAFDRSAVADLEVCPVAKAKQGEMQMVCIRSARDVKVQSP
ncbi:hypothetical protein [Dyella sp. Tek66A03]|uniref:hypothetical protein n=1 Tax=Dyella sp. Tek66A03 TaxID=3458298 RepID=UPI00403E3BA3